MGKAGFRVGALLTAFAILFTFTVTPLVALQYVPAKMMDTLFLGDQPFKNSIYELAVFGAVYSGLFFVKTFLKEGTTLQKGFKVLTSSFWLAILLYQFSSSGSFGEIRVKSLAGVVENSLAVSSSTLFLLLVVSIIMSIAYTLLKEFYIEINERG